MLLLISALAIAVLLFFPFDLTQLCFARILARCTILYGRGLFGISYCIRIF